MRTILRIFLLLLIGILAIGLYQFRFSSTPVKYRAADGKVKFGYDQRQRKWLIDEYQAFEPGTDGPHVFFKGDGTAMIVASQRGEAAIRKTTVRADSNLVLTCSIEDSASWKPLSFRMHDAITGPSVTPRLPERLLAISDIEGNFPAFYALLHGNGVIDSQYRWTFGTGHLVLVGDFMDRGENVLPCLYLIYKLEQEAAAAGGQVHFILGNHEQLNLQGYASYAQPKYLEVIRQLGIPYKELYGANTLLGGWLRSKNCIEQIGGYLFVHGGVSRDAAALGMSPDQLNASCRAAIDAKQEAITNSTAKLLLGRTGLLWYRGLAAENGREPVAGIEEVSSMLKRFGAQAIVIGHTVVPEVSVDFGGRVIRLDVHHADDAPQALLLQNGRAFRTGTDGKATPL